jgi:hypothetical protein
VIEFEPAKNVGDWRSTEGHTGLPIGVRLIIPRSALSMTIREAEHISISDMPTGITVSVIDGK